MRYGSWENFIKEVKFNQRGDSLDDIKDFYVKELNRYAGIVERFKQKIQDKIKNKELQNALMLELNPLVSKKNNIKKYIPSGITTRKIARTALTGFDKWVTDVQEFTNKIHMSNLAMGPAYDAAKLADKARASITEEELEEIKEQAGGYQTYFEALKRHLFMKKLHEETKKMWDSPDATAYMESELKESEEKLKEIDPGNNIGLMIDKISKRVPGLDKALSTNIFSFDFLGSFIKNHPLIVVGSIALIAGLFYLKNPKIFGRD